MRVRFAKEIVAEILLPEKQTGRVAILAIGLPSSPSKKEALQFLAGQGYVAILPRYRGTWESEGSFLEKSPALDIRDIIAELEKRSSVTDLYSGEIHSIRVSAIHLFGASFGGPAVLLNSHLPLVKKVIALSRFSIGRAKENRNLSLSSFVLLGKPSAAPSAPSTRKIGRNSLTQLSIIPSITQRPSSARRS